MQDGPYKQLLINELSRVTHLENYRIIQIIDEKISENITESSKKITNSPIRLAIALIIQNPEIFKSCHTQINIDLLDGQGQEILQKLMRQIKESPEANTAMLIEGWRGSPYFAPLTKLAGWEHKEPEEELIKKFIDIILFLQKQNLENKINQYLAKSRNQGLTVSERLMLQEMMKQRHQTAHDKN
jgi:DNA primase